MDTAAPVVCEAAARCVEPRAAGAGATCGRRQAPYPVVTHSPRGRSGPSCGRAGGLGEPAHQGGVGLTVTGAGHACTALPGGGPYDAPVIQSTWQGASCEPASYVVKQGPDAVGLDTQALSQVQNRL